MADTRGTWSLSEAWGEKTADEWVPVPSVFIANNGFGYSLWQAKGNASKTNIDTGVATLVGNNSVSYTNGCIGFSSPSSGYWAGGKSSSRSSVKKIDYSTETVTNQIPSDVPVTIYDAGAISAGDKSYLISGVQNGSSKSTTYKLVYSTETWSEIPSRYTVSWNGKSELQGSNAGNGTGYAYGGQEPSNNPVNGAKITFNTDTWSTAYPSTFVGATNGTGNLRSSTHCYFVGGQGTPSPTYLSDVKKFTFSNETWAASPSKMPDGVTEAASYPYNGSKGAVAGGVPSDYIGSGQPSLYTMSAAFTLTFATDTWDATSIASNADAYGYAEGNLSGCSAAENLASNAGVDGSKRWFDNLGDGPDVGYVTGGYSSPASYHNRSSTEKINMATDTANAIVPGGQMPRSAAAHGASFGNHQYGMTATLGAPAPDWSNGYTDCYRFTYSTETFSTVTPVALDNSTYETGGRGFNDPTANVGYYAGGNRSGEYGKSYVYKYSYSGDTWSSSPSLNQKRYWATNAQDNNNAWMLGGKGYNESGHAPLLSYTDKMSFSSGTWVLQPSVTFTGVTAGPSWQTRTHRMTYNACGDETAAYWASGFYWNDTAGCTNVWKLTYATGTIDNSGMYTTPSPNTFDLGGGLSNASKGYFAGGRYGAGNNTVNKFSYSTETISALSPGMTEGRMSAFTFGPRKLGSRLTAPEATPTSSTTLSGPEGLKLEGYIGKGRQADQPSGNNGRTDLTKLSYSTETWSSSASGGMPNGKKFPGATSNTTRGYWAGGTPGNSSIVDKFVWSTNTGSTIPATLGSARSYASSAAGNQTQGYFTFGSPGTYQNACDKLVYSNETMSNLPSMPFKSARAVAISMQTAGYYGSGSGQDDKGSYFTKITFATDTKSGSIPGWRAHSSGSNMFRSGSSSSTKAYVCCGESTTRAMEVTPWATNSVSTLPTTFMPADATGTKGQGDNTNAYFTGGPAPSGGSLTQRVVYSSDTVSVLPGANFPGGKVSAYGAGGPGMNGIANSVPNVI